MYLVSAALPDTVLEVPPDGLAYGIPCAFKGCAGFFHPAGGDVGVVLCSPWGFEDLIMRKSWRLLAEAIAGAGYPCVRFDYPGTGDSLGRATDIASVERWVTAVGAAADVLRLNTGVRRFVFIGQTLGALLAVEAARSRTDVIGLQLIAPVVSGRVYARELGVIASMVAERIGIKLEPTSEEALNVLGFSMSHSLLASLKGLDLRKVDDLDARRIVIHDQAGRKAGAEAIEHFRKFDIDVSVTEVEPFHLMVSDSTVIQPLPVTIAQVLDGLQRQAPIRPRPAPLPPDFPAALVTDGFREEGIRFGADEALFGVLCRPARPMPGAATVILLNRGLNTHVGWGRSSVEHARGLAAAGITSLRIDVAGLGESRDDPTRPANLIYSDLLLDDITAAVDLLTGNGCRRIALAGVCSGAYMALRAGGLDPRITDIMAVNTQRFVWNPRESVEDVIRYGLRSMNDYVGDLKSKGALRKLVRSRSRILPALGFLVRRTLKSAFASLPLGLRSILRRQSMDAYVLAYFSLLAMRGTRVSLVYGAGDPGLIELRAYFGKEGRKMRFPNVAVTIFPNVDHNLTTTRASTWMLDHLVAFAGAEPNAAADVALPAQVMMRATG